ncbi:MAG: sulfatase [Thermodesulfobacteriota bacterium]
MTRRIPLLLVAQIAALPGRSAAQCSTADELVAFQQTVKRQVQCASAGLESQPACSAISPPCAGGALSALLDVALAGPPAPAADPATMQAQLRCQRAILRAAGSYLGPRPREIARGIRRAKSSRVLPRVQAACRGATVVADGATALPRLGGACAGAIGAPGSAVDAERAGRCLRAALEGIAQSVAPAPLPPNVVLIVTDDQNLASLAHMPKVRVELADRGVTFANAFVTTPVCSPSRASILTGLQARHHGVTDNFDAATRFGSSDNVARWFREAGYRTGLVGKFLNMTFVIGTTVPPHWDEWVALLEEGSGDGDGFYDYALNDNGRLVSHGSAAADYSTDVLADRAADFVRANARRPFFLVFTPYAPHPPAASAPRHERYFLLLDPWRPPNWRPSDVSSKPRWVQFMKSAAQPPDATDLLRAAQLRTLQAVDDAVEALAKRLEGLGLTDNTIVVFTSDNGYHWGEQWWPSKFAPYEESLRVPLIVRFPRLRPQPATAPELALNIDLAPTLADLAGVALPAQVDGESLAAVVAGGSGGRADFLIQSGGAFIVPEWVGVRSERWKYALLDAQRGITEELYDLEQDPYELQNLAVDAAHAATLDAMRARLAELTAD